MNYKIEHHDYEEGDVIFKNGGEIGKVYILASGEIEIYLTTADEDLILDTCKENGCLMGQFTILEPNRLITYSARTISSVTMLELSTSKIEQTCELFKDLQQSIRKVKEQLNS